MNISVFAFFLAVGALVIMASSLIVVFSRLERKQKQKRKHFFQA